jgi:hypothetical protein
MQNKKFKNEEIKQGPLPMQKGSKMSPMTFKVTTPVTAQTPINSANTDVEMQSANLLQGSSRRNDVMPGFIS